MFFIADIPPVTETQNIRYEYIVEAKQNEVHFLDNTEFHALIFLRQANRFAYLSKNTDFNKAELNYERMALINFQAYLQRLGK